MIIDIKLVFWDEGQFYTLINNVFILLCLDGIYLNSFFSFPNFSTFCFG